MAKRLILVLGGARSGKSRWAEALAGRLGRRVLYLATAEAGDPEMAARIAHHRARRPPSWRTLEAPRRVGEALAREAQDADVALLDCLTLLANNILLPLGDDPDEGEAEARLQKELDALLAAYEAGAARLIVVANEVGWGLVPSYPLGRVYRDLLGRAQQRLAAHADGVYLVVAGIPVDLKKLEASLEDL
ncbi:MAG TPA: bifunctional adenosylcobinamide kinase/adenosylcobinamide-phosphate guanylyltransferase [Anaerolineae bacterium]|nr:bifunctional adenosylcobinamide kinase/adenosylcobinamide-phosphate guanylyltransferase [Anaerolineae bacterium]